MWLTMRGLPLEDPDTDKLHLHQQRKGRVVEVWMRSGIAHTLSQSLPYEWAQHHPATGP